MSDRRVLVDLGVLSRDATPVRPYQRRRWALVALIVLLLVLMYYTGSLDDMEIRGR